MKYKTEQVINEALRTNTHCSPISKTQLAWQQLKQFNQGALCVNDQSQPERQAHSNGGGRG
ncbi:hypothetical protein [Rhodopseudomonas sp. B29]|uniref:hypothetical protein n=1 Tax=Rhodopseudomonas sp. B29 TaxID=95607 RepID=UPI0011D292F8|nr:hypothetical protein [Rhodopseudomonas sp. B29]